MVKSDISDSEEEVYDVERILNDRVVNGRKEYFIKWVGYPDEDNTWEDAKNIFSPELLEEYEQEKKKAKAAAKPKGKQAAKPAFKVVVTNEWDDKIKKIIGVFKDDKSGLQVEYVTCDGKKGVAPRETIHVKAPIKLLEFYEENLSFPDE